MFSKYWILGIVLIVLFGYYLGITIASVVDYRLKDAIINLPQPKVYINTEDEKIIEKFENNSKKKKNKNKNKTSKKKTFENFESTIKKTSEDTIVDQNQKAYAMSYKLAKTIMDNPFPFKAANSYDYDQVYTNLEKKE
jgi:thymidylate kinase